MDHKLSSGTQPNEAMFPTLTAAQMQRALSFGEIRPAKAGEVVVEQGDSSMPFLVVVSSEMEIARPTNDGESIIAVHKAGNFFGDVGMLSGRLSVVRARMRVSGELLRIERQAVQQLVQTDSELGEILARAFILRRVEMISQGWGDVVLLGSDNSAASLRLKGFLSRNGYPFTYADFEQDAGARELVHQFQLASADIPVLICRGK